MTPSNTLLTTFDIHEPTHITDTGIASIWQVTRRDNTPAALKIYQDGNMQDEAPGFDLLAAQNGQGAAYLYGRTDGAVLLEWLDGASLGDLVRAGKDDAASAILIETANRLHQMPATTRIDSLDPLEARFAPLFNARFTPDCPAAVKNTLNTARTLAADLLVNQSDIRPLHGDFHHENIRLGTRGYLAFDAKGVLGERTFELANAFRNPLGSEDHTLRPETISRRADIWCAGFNVSKNHLLSWAAAFSGLSLAWTHNATFGPACAKDAQLIDTLLQSTTKGG